MDRVLMRVAALLLRGVEYSAKTTFAMRFSAQPTSPVWEPWADVRLVKSVPEKGSGRSWSLISISTMMAQRTGGSTWAARKIRDFEMKVTRENR